jgi:hypothetical protein
MVNPSRYRIEGQRFRQLRAGSIVRNLCVATKPSAQYLRRNLGQKSGKSSKKYVVWNCDIRLLGDAVLLTCA